MNRLGTLLLLALVGFLGYRLYKLIEKEVKEAVQYEPNTNVVSSAVATGMPPELEISWQRACEAGPAAMSNWLARFAHRVSDPRRACIELDYCEKIAWANPAEARRVFNAVKARVSTNSPVYRRIKSLEPAFR
ncbi:MAG: hypothetical protein NZ739_00845 [Verrucomicrobiae bacterium]|nr:hypothetical protein [Verrucomicrobiae bacterium]MDW7980157.1 hypothetical protein [Verrucomicrobiales bacterium]